MSENCVDKRGGGSGMGVGIQQKKESGKKWCGPDSSRCAGMVLCKAGVEKIKVDPRTGEAVGVQLEGGSMLKAP